MNSNLVDLYKADTSRYASAWDAITKIFSAQVQQSTSEAEIGLKKVMGKSQENIDIAKVQVAENQGQVDLYKADTGKFAAAWEAVGKIFSAEVDQNAGEAEIGLKKALGKSQENIDIGKIGLGNNQGLVDLYKAEVGKFSAAWDAISKIYSAEVQKSSAKADFGLKKVMGKSQEKIDIAKADIAENQGKIDLYKADVGKFAAVWDAITKMYSSKIQASTAKADVGLKKIQTQLQRNVELAKVQSTVNDNKVDKYKADTGQFAASIDGLTKMWAAKAQENASAAELGLKQALGQLQEKSQVYGMKKEAVRAAASLAAQLMSAALGGVSAGVSYGFHQQISESVSSTQSMSQNCSEINSTSESKNTNFNYSQTKDTT
jgi:hypothetical protein